MKEILIVSEEEAKQVSPSVMLKYDYVLVESVREQKYYILRGKHPESPMRVAPLPDIDSYTDYLVHGDICEVVPITMEE